MPAPKTDSIVIPLKNYKDTVGSRVAPGDYLVLVEDADPSTSKAGNPMVNLNLRVIGGEFDGANIVDRLTMTEKAMFRVVAFMQAINLPTPREDIRVPLAKFRGKKLVVTVEDGEPFNGTIRSEVRAYARATREWLEAVGVGAKTGTAAADLEDLEPADVPTPAVEPTVTSNMAEPTPEPEQVAQTLQETSAAYAEEPLFDQSSGEDDDDSGAVDLDSLDL